MHGPDAVGGEASGVVEKGIGEGRGAENLYFHGVTALFLEVAEFPYQRDHALVDNGYALQMGDGRAFLNLHQPIEGDFGIDRGVPAGDRGHFGEQPERGQTLTGFIGFAGAQSAAVANSSMPQFGCR
ncbi:hypothetical protein NKH77_48445 [Streptomyces sp. M19]